MKNKKLKDYTQERMYWDLYMDECFLLAHLDELLKSTPSIIENSKREMMKRIRRLEHLIWD